MRSNNSWLAACVGVLFGTSGVAVIAQSTQTAQTADAVWSEELAAPTNASSAFESDARALLLAASQPAFGPQALENARWVLTFASRIRNATSADGRRRLARVAGPVLRRPELEAALAPAERESFDQLVAGAAQIGAEARLAASQGADHDYRIAVLGLALYSALPVTAASRHDLERTLVERLWAWPREHDEATLCRLVARVQDFAERHSRTRVNWREWIAPVLLQGGRDRSDLVWTRDVPPHWRAVDDLLEPWLAVRVRRLGQSRTGCGLTTPTLDQPDGTELAGDHPRVLALMRAKFDALADPEGLRQFRRWLVDDRALRTTRSAAAVLLYLARDELASEWFAVDPRGGWQQQLAPGPSFVRAACEKVVGAFGSDDRGAAWTRADFARGFSENEVLTAHDAGRALLDALRQTGRAQLLGSWRDLRAEIRSGTGARGAAAFARSAHNPWCEPWLLVLAKDARPQTFEAHARLRERVARMRGASIAAAARSVHAELAMSSVAPEPWRLLATLDPWDELRERAVRGDPEIRDARSRLFADLRDWHGGDPEWTPRQRGSLMILCWLGVPTDDAGRRLSRELGKAREHKLHDSFTRWCCLTAFATSCRHARSHSPGADLLAPLAPESVEELGRFFPDSQDCNRPFAARAVCDAFFELPSVLGEVRHDEHDTLRRLARRVRALFPETPRGRDGRLPVDLAATRLLDDSRGAVEHLAEATDAGLRQAVHDLGLDYARALIAHASERNGSVRRRHLLSIDPVNAGKLELQRRVLSVLTDAVDGVPVADGPRSSLRELCAGVEDLRARLTLTARRATDIDGFDVKAMPVRTFAAALTDLDAELAILRQAQEVAAEPEAAETVRDAIGALRKSVDAQLDFDLRGVEQEYRAALAELRRAEAVVDSRRHAVLAQELAHHAAALFAQAAAVRERAAEVDKLIAKRESEKARIGEAIAEIETKIREKRIVEADGKQEIADLEAKKRAIAVEILAHGVGLLESQIKLAKEALVEPTRAINPDTKQPFAGEFDGRIGALARVGEHELGKLEEQLRNKLGKIEKRLKKLRGGGFLRALTMVLGAAASLIPGAGPFLGAGIVAAGEIAAGIYEGRSFDQIVVGLGDNAIEIAAAAGVDLEQELDKLRGAVGDNLAAALGDIESALGPLLEQMPAFLDAGALENVFRDIGSDHRLKPLYGALYDLTRQWRKLETSGFTKEVLGAAAVVQAATSRDLVGELKQRLRKELLTDNAKLRQLADVARQLGIADLERGGRAADRFADRVSKLVVARAGSEMIELRQRIVSTMAIATQALQRVLGSVERIDEPLSDFVATEEFLEKLAWLPAAERGRVQDYLKGFVKKLDEAARRTVGPQPTLSWTALQPVIEAELARLLPHDPRQRVLLVQRMRLTADPEYAATELAKIIQPWQAAMQTRLNAVTAELSRPVSGEEKQQLVAKRANIDRSLAKLKQTCAWLQNGKSPERRAVQQQLNELADKLAIARKKLEQGEIEVAQAEIGQRLAAVRREIASLRLDQSEHDLGRSRLDVDIGPEREKIKGHLHRAQQLEAAAFENEHESLAARIDEARELLRAAGASRDARAHDANAAEERLRFAEAWRRDRSVARKWTARVPDAGADAAVRAAGAHVRSMLRLLRASGIAIDSPALRDPFPLDRGQQLARLDQVRRELVEAWNDQCHSWVADIDLEPSEIESLFSPAGVTLEILPGAGNNTVRRDSLIVRELPFASSARIVTVIFVVGNRVVGVRPNEIRFSAVDQTGWQHEWSWLGTRVTREGQHVGVSNAFAILDVPEIPWSGDYVPYTPEGEPTDLTALLEERITVYTEIDRKGGMKWRPAATRLGPPLFGRHHLRIRHGSSMPHNVRVCVLYLHDRR